MSIATGRSAGTASSQLRRRRRDHPLDGAPWSWPRQRTRFTACRSQLDEPHALLVDHLESTVEALDPGLPVVEGLDAGEATLVARQAVRTDVGPSRLVAGASEALVEHVQVDEPAAMQDGPGVVDVGMATVLPLDHRRAITVVART
jgi:hypothetical protein